MTTKWLKIWTFLLLTQVHSMVLGTFTYACKFNIKLDGNPWTDVLVNVVIKKYKNICKVLNIKWIWYARVYQLKKKEAIQQYLHVHVQIVPNFQYWVANTRRAIYKNHNDMSLACMWEPISKKQLMQHPCINSVM